jgi:hypothetical protein
MTGPDELVTPLGRIPVRHRLALAVEAVDAVTGRPAFGVRVTRETRRPAPAADNGRGRLVLRHDRPLPATVLIQLDDPAGRWVPRRLEVAIFGYDEVRAADLEPPAGVRIPAEARAVRPWLKPATGYPAPAFATGVRFGVRRGRARIPWPRLEVFDSAGRPTGWAHGDSRGEVLVLIHPGPGAAGAVPIVVRVHEPAAPSPLPAAEPVARAPSEPVIRGDTLPPGYLPRTTDHLLSCTVGRVAGVADLDIS